MSKKYCVTIVHYGCLFIEADSPEQAKDIADRQTTDTVSWNEDWTPIDADEVDENDDLYKYEHYISKPAF